MRRPMNRVITPLSMMGASIESDGGRPPLSIRGDAPLRSVKYVMPVASAQVKSAILLAGLYASGKTEVTEPAVTRDHTERMLQSMGAAISSNDGTISVVGGRQLRALDTRVPADLSSAAFLMLAALIAKDSDVLLKNVGVNPTRTGVIDVLQQMGADIVLANQCQSGGEPVADIRVRSSKLKGIAVDPALVSLAIDEFPVLFAAAAVAKGTTTFSGIGELRVKESDRISSMATGLAALGISVRESNDGAEIRGGRLCGGTVESFADHRVAMAFAIAGCVASGPVVVRNTANVDTSFPEFVSCANALGIDINKQEAPA